MRITTTKLIHESNNNGLLDAASNFIISFINAKEMPNAPYAIYKICLSNCDELSIYALLSCSKYILFFSSIFLIR